MRSPYFDMKVAYISVKQRAIGLMAGLALITVGIVVHSKLTVYLAFFGTQTNPLAILLLAMGAIVFIIGFFGCCGAYKRNYCLAIAFAVLLALVIVTEIAAAVTAYFFHSELELYVITDMMTTIRMYDQSDVIRTAWDTAHTQFGCCGATNFTNWAEVNSSSDETNDTTSGSVPESCCISELVTQLRNSCQRNIFPDENSTKADIYTNIYTKGCAAAVRLWFEENLLIIILICIGLAAVQFTGIVLTCCLARNIRLESGVS